MIGLLICCAPPIEIPIGLLEYGVTILAVVKIALAVGKSPLTIGTPLVETLATWETLTAATPLVKILAASIELREKIELISELVKYQDHHAKILKYQAQQSKPLSKKEQREYYMSILRIHAGWKTKHFRGMTLEEIKEKFILVWKQLEDFIPMSSKEESERVKRLGLKLDQGSSKRMKTSEDVSEEEIKGMMQLVPLEEVYVEALQLWTHNQAFMHDPLEWKLYDICGVHHVSSKDQEIFMLVEKDYLLRKGLAIVMIIQDEELIEASSPDEHLILEN
nr:hypothetical protein [Tanacetum cinerariifolium]